MLEEEILLRDMNPDDFGAFMLFKSKFIVEGQNYPRIGRCDNADFSPVSVASDTEYEWQTLALGGSSAYRTYRPEIKHFTRYEKIVSAPPDFFIVFLEFSQIINGQKVRPVDLRTESAPSVMWGGRTIYSLLKNMREWSFLIDEPFNSDHPMAVYSQKALEVLDPPKSIIEEIDSMPDMHLSKFLKGDSSYRDIPFPYPSASDELKTWVMLITERYPEKTIDEVI